MNTRAQALAAGVLEAVLLLAVALVPAFVNYYSFRVYEPDKAALLLALALLGGLAALVVVVEARGRGLAAAFRQPLVGAAVLLGAATLVATLTTTLRPPWASLFGADERAMGLLTTLAGLLLFAAAGWLAREPERRARLVAALLLGSVPAALVALLQAAGYPLVQGIVESKTRVFGTLSNPIFLGAYLMMVLPLTLARLVAPGQAPGRRLAWGLLALLQAAALAASVSRGPLLGLFVALVVLAVAWGLGSGRRGLAWGGVALALAVPLFLLVFNLPGSPLAPLREVPVVGRFGRISDTSGGSEAARLNIWRGVTAALAAEPARLLTGHGPESLKYLLLEQGQVSLGGRGQADRLVDRAHNVLLDALSMTGVLGALALVLVFGAWLATAARAAGLAASRGAGRLLAGLLAAGATLGALAGLLPGGAPFAGATTLLGLALALGLYLLVALLRSPGSSGEGEAEADGPPFDPLPGALLAIGAAVVVEAAFGIQTVATQTVFWALAGLVLATAARPLTAAERLPEADAETAPGAVTLSWSPGSGALGVVAGALLSSLAYSYVIQGVAADANVLALVVLVAVGVLAAGALAARDLGEPASGLLLTALALGLAYLGLRWLGFQLTQDAAQVFALTLWWFLALALLAGWWLRAAVPATAPLVRPLAAGVYLVAAILASTVVFLFAIRPVQAGIYFQSAAANFGAVLTALDAGNPTASNAAGEVARTLFERAERLAPENDVYPARWSEMYTRLALALPDASQSAVAFAEAQAQIARAEALDPQMPYHTFNRGHLQLLAVDRMPSEQRPAVAQNAVVALQQAFDRLNADPQVANELALAKLLAGDAKGAEALLDYSLTLAPDKAETYALKGRVLDAAGRLDEAKMALEKAYQQGLAGPEVLVTLGEVSRKAGNLQEAVQYYQQAVDTGQVRDWQVVFNLGLLYRDLGEFEKALQFLQVALQVAPPEQQAAVQQALDDAVSSRASVAPAPGSLPANPPPGAPGSPFGASATPASPVRP